MRRVLRARVCALLSFWCILSFEKAARLKKKTAKVEHPRKKKRALETAHWSLIHHHHHHHHHHHGR
jgi:hypothetical protein